MSEVSAGPATNTAPNPATNTEAGPATSPATNSATSPATQTNREREIEAAIDTLNELWEFGGPEMPAWVAHELTFSQMRLLFLLDKNAPLPVSGVAEWLGVGMPAASGTIDRLERHGLVTRSHRRDDRRVVECDLTDEGRRLVDQIYGMRTEIIRRFLEVLTQDEMADMARLISIVHERMKARNA